MTHKNWGVVLGLTGGIGSGKSLVLEMFRQKGAFTLDADRIVHAALLKKNVLDRIRRQFGASVFNPDKSLNRKEMARVVFKSPARRKKLERILHPLVRHEMDRALKKKKGKIAVCDIPLLYETKGERRFKWVVVVSAKDSLRRQRLLKKGFSLPDIRARFKTQWPLSRKVKKADFVVTNNGTKQQTKKQIDAIWNELLRRIHGISART